MKARKPIESTRARSGAEACCAFAAVLLAAGPAAGDADEASAHAQVVAGLVRVTESGAAGGGPFIGAGARLTLARSDRWAFEAQTVGLTAESHYDDITITVAGAPRRGVLDRPLLAGRLELGAHMRFGARWVPTVHVALGAQVRQLGATTLRSMDGGPLADVAAATSLDATAALGVGLDRRIGRSLVVGVMVGGVHAVPVAGDGGGFDGFEMTAHVAWYWYPRWLPLAKWRGAPGDDG